MGDDGLEELPNNCVGVRWPLCPVLGQLSCSLTRLTRERAIHVFLSVRSRLLFLFWMSVAGNGENGEKWKKDGDLHLQLVVKDNRPINVSRQVCVSSPALNLSEAEVVKMLSVLLSNDLLINWQCEKNTRWFIALDGTLHVLNE